MDVVLRETTTRNSLVDDYGFDFNLEIKGKRSKE